MCVCVRQFVVTHDFIIPATVNEGEEGADHKRSHCTEPASRRRENNKGFQSEHRGQLCPPMTHLQSGSGFLLYLMNVPLSRKASSPNALEMSRPVDSRPKPSEDTAFQKGIPD